VRRFWLWLAGTRLSDLSDLPTGRIEEHSGAFGRGVVPPEWPPRDHDPARAVGDGKGRSVLVLLWMLGGKRGMPAARALAELVYRRGTEPASEALMRWTQ
jgi:hypothetical protein